MDIDLDDAARDLLGEAGFDPVYGARPLKRAIQQQIENPLAQRILQGEFVPGDRIRVVAQDGELAFPRRKNARRPAANKPPAAAGHACTSAILAANQLTAIKSAMPFYEYECQACKFYAEVMQKITDAPLTKCPSCGKRALKKLVSAPVFRLKGGGWYETDFKSDKENKRNLAGADKEEAKAETKPETKTEAKAEAKADGKGEVKDAKGPAKESKEAKPNEPKAGSTQRRSVRVAGTGGGAREAEAAQARA